MQVRDERAAPVRTHFYAQPNPKWEFERPRKDGYRQEQNFLEDRMRAWFG